MVFLLAYKFIKELCCFWESLLMHSNLRSSIEVPRWVLVNNGLESWVSHSMKAKCVELINESKVHIITICWLHLLILGHNLWVVNNLNSVVNRLSTEVLVVVIEWLELSKFPHSCNFGNSNMLSRHSRSSHLFIYKAHQQVRVNIFPFSVYTS